MHQFFHFGGPFGPPQFGGPPPPQQETISAEMQNNLIVLEMYNNWEFVRELFFKMVSGELKNVDELETTWVSYINSNGLDLRNYNDEEDFLYKHLRELVPA